jgi:DNA-binding transcriptional LysR family regulator
MASMFDLTQVRCFIAVAEELHFGRAASRLNMTQPPVSRQIQVLEQHIGALLLERTSRSVRLTPAGRSFLPEARNILQLAERASLVARRIATGKSGSLRIGFTAASAYGFLPTLITACRQRITDIDLSLLEMVSGEQFEALAARQIDVGFLRPPVVRPELMSMRVAAEGLLAALPARHRLTHKKSLALKDFHDQPFIMHAPYESRYFYDLVTAHLVGANVLPRYVQHISQIHSMLAFVRAGMGLAIVPEAAANLRFNGVVMRPLQLPVTRPVELMMAWRRDNDNALFSTLIEIVGSMADVR